MAGDTANGFLYVKESRKGFDDTVVSLLRAIDANGWALFQVHDIKERLAAKGFAHGNIKVIELCSAKHANKILLKNPVASAGMPCRISVFAERGKTLVASMRPSAMARIMEGISEEDSMEAERDILKIIGEAVQ
ncbi:MAG: DUF302 domain-containing protein [Candidatus Aenigmarchaeota archaeon]|nr:DUF302 domain-containing protein [Candidatus Aenigmarchaeota archaeon]